MTILIKFWYRIKHWFFKTPIPSIAYYVTEEPEVLNKENIYIAGESGHYWYICFLCPCGCGEIIQLSTLVNDNPKWSFIKHRNKTITIYPSIWRTSGCKSHFFIRKGIVDWCKN